MSNCVCPKCNHEFAVSLKATIPDEQRISLGIKPNSSGMFEARTLGLTIDNFRKLLQCVGKDMGASLSVFVEKINQSDNGEITIDFLLLERKKPAEPAIHAR